MKKTLLFIIGLLIVNLNAYSQEEYEYTFDISEFSITKENNGKLHIECSNSNYQFMPDAQSAPFPFMPLDIARKCSGKDRPMYMFEREVLMTDVDENLLCDSVTRNIKMNIYGKDTIEPMVYVGNNVFNGQSFSSFIVSPFEYDRESKTIYFIKKITVSFPKVAGDEVISDNSNLMLTSIPTSFAGPDYDCLIVTTDVLKEQFEEVASLHRYIGIRTEVVTMEEIRNHPAFQHMNDDSKRLKQYIYLVYLNRNIRSVLLGGDDTHIPSRFCCMQIYADGRWNLGYSACDSYFSSFDNNFDWDTGNNNYGEPSDDIDLIPNISIGRWPVSTPDDVRSSYMKLYTYVMNSNNKSTSDFYGNLLFIGNSLGESVYDAYNYGNRIYANHVAHQPEWSGNKYTLTNYLSNLINGNTSTLTEHSFLAQLSLPYHIIHHLSHGNIGEITLPDRPLKTGDLINFSFTNEYPFLMLASTCNFNQYSDDDKCWGELLMNASGGGAIGVYGGYNVVYYDKANSNLTGAILHNAKIMEYIYSGDLGDMPYNLGNIIRKAKYLLHNNATTYNMDRWNLLSMNLFGDPEMDIYTCAPNVFDFVSVVNTSNKVSVDTFVDGCDIILMSTDNGASDYRVASNTRSCIFENIRHTSRIIVRKHNYVPYISDYVIAFDDASSTFVCDSVVYSLTDVPDGCHVTWSTPGYSNNSAPRPRVYPNYPSLNTCMIKNPYKYATEIPLSAMLISDYDNSILGCTSKTVYTEANGLNANYRQEHCAYYGVSHPSISSTSLHNGDVIFVHQGCLVHINSLYLRNREITYNGQTPSVYQEYEDEILFSLPLYSGGTPFHIYVGGDGACNTEHYTFFSISNNQNMNSTSASVGLSGSDIIIELQGNNNDMMTEGVDNSVARLNVIEDWSVEVYNTPRGERVYSVGGLRGDTYRINTTGWKEGTYIVRVVGTEEILSDKVYVKQ